MSTEHKTLSIDCSSAALGERRGRDGNSFRYLPCAGSSLCHLFVISVCFAVCYLFLYSYSVISCSCTEDWMCLKSWEQTNTTESFLLFFSKFNERDINGGNGRLGYWLSVMNSFLSLFLSKALNLNTLFISIFKHLYLLTFHKFVACWKVWNSTQLSEHNLLHLCLC